MRIIAGKYRGSKLNTLEGLKTRPTLDGTKEAIFSSLGGYIPGFVVLDIFGGSGALSLESLSRGAVKAYIIDNNIDAINIIKSNAAKLKVGNELVVYLAEYKNVLEKMKHMKFDLVFIDPPFRMKVIDEIISFLVENDMIAEEGYIMAEYPMEDVVEKQYDGFNVKLCRRYSSSEVLILEKE